MVLDRKNQVALALLCLASGRLPNASNSSDVYFDVPTGFAGGDRLSIPYVASTMSVLRIDWPRFLYWYVTSYGSHFSVYLNFFCFAAQHKKATLIVS